MYRQHLFICINGKDVQGKCGSKNGEALHAKVKERAKELNLKNVRINKSGCLGPCERGISAVLYPKGQWFHELTENDDTKLIQALQESEGE